MCRKDWTATNCGKTKKNRSYTSNLKDFDVTSLSMSTMPNTTEKTTALRWGMLDIIQTRIVPGTSDATDQPKLLHTIYRQFESCDTSHIETLRYIIYRKKSTNSHIFMEHIEILRYIIYRISIWYNRNFDVSIYHSPKSIFRHITHLHFDISICHISKLSRTIANATITRASTGNG